MLYTLEIFPNGKERIGMSTFFLANNYAYWRKLVQEELRFFYAKDYRIDIEIVLTTVLNHVKKDIPFIYQIEMFGATFKCLVTEELSPMQFQNFVLRHSEDIMLRIERDQLDETSLFFHWLKYHQFKQISYHCLLEAFRQSNYTFFQKESTASLKVLISKMVKDMEELFQKNQKRDEEWFKKMEEIQARTKPISNIENWLVPSEKESFLLHRTILKKEYALILIEQRLPLVANSY